MARDLLGQIADARAQMMMRGYDPLTLEMGQATAREFARQSQIVNIDEGNEVLTMPITIRLDMEGWAVRPATD